MHPVLRFLAGSLLALAVVVIGGFFALRSIAVDEAELRTRAQVQLEGRLVQAAGLEDGVLAGDRQALRRLDDLVIGQILTPSVVRVKLWTRAGRILYSDEQRLIGQRFELGDEELALFAEGGADAELSDLGEPENRYERQEGKLLEAHTVIRTPDDTQVLFETYQRFSSVSADASRLLGAIAPPLLGGLAVLLLLQVPLAYSLARRLQRSHRMAIEASDAERRRIAADLHDGVVQDVAGVAFGLAATDEAAASRLRQSVRDLRTLLVEINPPSLESTGLEAALKDLLSPFESAGVTTSLRVDQPSTSDDALVYRAAREALRNVAEHAEASRVDVIVAGDCLEARDDGRGFDATERAARREEGHLGLSLLEDLVQRSGGKLEVRSEPGLGTTVIIELKR